MVAKTMLAVLGIFLGVLPTALAQDGLRQSYYRIDRSWVGGLDLTTESVTSRMARALALTSGQTTEDGCGCKMGGSGEILDPVRCPSVFDTHDERMAKVRAVPVVTAGDWAFNLSCFRDGDAMCRKGGISYVGETCCKMVDSTFLRIKGDLNFYVIMPEPVAEKINGYVYRETESMRPVVESCSVMVDEKERAWSMGPNWRGFVARAWLYADRYYGANTPFALGVLRKLSNETPRQAWEVERNRRIGISQSGRQNSIQ